MIKKLQSIATMRYCLADFSDKKGSDTLESCNALRQYWLDKGWTDSFKPSEILNGNNIISPGLIVQLDKEFPGAAQVYFYGPEGSYLWRALESPDIARKSVLILSKILGSSIDQIRELSDTHWKLLMREVPEIGFHILAYYLYRLHEHKECSNLDISTDKITVISIGRLCIWGKIDEYLQAYGLCLNDLYAAMESNKKPYSTNIDRFDTPPLPKIFIKSSFSEQTSLGIYLLNHLDCLNDKSDSYLTNEGFIENETSKWKLNYC